MADKFDRGFPEIIKDLQHNQIIMNYLVSLSQVKKTKFTKKFIDLEFEKTVRKRKQLFREMKELFD